MTDAAIRPFTGPPATPNPGLAPPSRSEGPKVLPAFRFIPSQSPLLGDIGVLANTYARAAAEAEVARDTRKAADGGAEGDRARDREITPLR